MYRVRSRSEVPCVRVLPHPTFYSGAESQGHLQPLQLPFGEGRLTVAELLAPP
jgi:hypothetical protein